MNLEQEAREQMIERAKNFIEGENWYPCRSMPNDDFFLANAFVNFHLSESSHAAEQNRDLIAERDGLRERVEMAKIAIDRAIYDLWGGGDNDRIERELR